MYSIEFTFAPTLSSGVLPFTSATGYLDQYSTWIPNRLRNNIVHKPGDTITLYGTDALEFRNLVDASILPFTYRIVPYPVIDSINPGVGYLSGMNPVVLSGSGFSAASRVQFGATIADTFGAQSDTTLVAYPFPVASSRTVDVSVQNSRDFSDSVKYRFVSKTLTGTKEATYSLGISFPNSICLGPDGNLWGTNSTHVFKVTPSGVVTVYNSPISPTAVVGKIIAGTDGNLWTYCASITSPAHTLLLLKVTTSGAFTTYTIHSDTTGSQQGNGFCFGPDGNLWLVGSQISTFPNPSWIFKIGLDGTVLGQYTLPTDFIPFDAVSAPDGNIYITCNTSQVDNDSALLRVTMDGVITTVVTAPGISYGGAACIGPDGNLWTPDLDINTFAPGALNKIALGSFVSTRYSTETFGGDILPEGCIAGPDGNIWLADGGGDFSGNGSLWKFTTSGAVTQYSSPGTLPVSIAVDLDGALWSPDQTNGTVMKFT